MRVERKRIAVKGLEGTGESVKSDEPQQDEAS